jgi:uncharacterized C2H2 Zn-finger protein
MPRYRITEMVQCPHCDHVYRADLRTGEPSEMIYKSKGLDLTEPPGVTLQCPKCNKPFKLPESSEASP